MNITNFNWTTSFPSPGLSACGSLSCIRQLMNEKEWLYTAKLSPSFDFLKDPEEDIYTLSDGKPYYDET